MDEIEKLQNKSDKHFNFISGFVHDYCEEEKDRKEFFKHLGKYLECELELEKECGN